MTVAAPEGEAACVRHFQPDQTGTVVQFVRQRSSAPRVCVASTGGPAVRLALALAELPQAEVILLRPAALPRTDATTAGLHSPEMALALARYARRAA